MPEIRDNRITHQDFGSMTAPLELDLTFAFKVWQQNVFDLIAKAEKDHWTDTKFLNEIEKMEET